MRARQALAGNLTPSCRGGAARMIMNMQQYARACVCMRQLTVMANLCIGAVLVYDLSGPTVCEGHRRTDERHAMMRWYEYPHEDVDVQSVVVDLMHKDEWVRGRVGEISYFEQPRPGHHRHRHRLHRQYPMRLTCLDLHRN